MKHFHYYLLLLFLFGCSPTTESEETLTQQPSLPYDPDLPSASKSYETSKGGVQMARIFYDQNANSFELGDTDEVVVLWTFGTANTSGWYLNAGDDKQDYLLPSAINGALYIYTKQLAGKVPGKEITPGLNTWIWNNIEPDTAYLYNASHQIVDSLTYSN